MFSKIALSTTVLNLEELKHPPEIVILTFLFSRISTLCFFEILHQHDRAAQFTPFAALVGYDDEVVETARLTESRPKLDKQEQQAINERLAYIANHIHEQPEVRIKYFVPDEHKSSGAIVEASSKVKKISATDGTIVMVDGCQIRLSDITGLSIG